MMGVLPLQFLDGETPETLGLTGRESFAIIGVANGEAGRGDGARRRAGVPRAASASTRRASASTSGTAASFRT